MTSFVAKPSEVTHGWILIDAENLVVGRLASFVASRLRGKHRPDFTPHVDCGDHVVVINADKVKLTGKKAKDKIYYRHTGYPGGIKSRTPKDIMASRYPQRVLEMAITRMMPKNSPLAQKQISKLRVYSGTKHEHEAQKPVKYDFSIDNKKNIRLES